MNHPSVHRCPECCQALSYIDSCLQIDYKEYGTHQPWWWRIRHPVFAFIIAPAIRDYAATMLDESGK